MIIVPIVWLLVVSFQLAGLLTTTNNLMWPILADAMVMIADDSVFSKICSSSFSCFLSSTLSMSYLHGISGLWALLSPTKDIFLVVLSFSNSPPMYNLTVAWNHVLYCVIHLMYVCLFGYAKLSSNCGNNFALALSIQVTIFYSDTQHPWSQCAIWGYKHMGRCEFEFEYKREAVENNKQLMIWFERKTIT